MKSKVKLEDSGNAHPAPWSAAFTPLHARNVLGRSIHASAMAARSGLKLAPLRVLGSVFAFAVCPRLLAAPAAPVDAFNVVWDSPSANHHGSMPLGNGDIALNAWMTEDGDLQFYISKTDAWDDNARLLKIGKVPVHFEPNPIAPGKAFRQELKLNEGCIEIRTGTSPSTLN